jgi:hypothetical protein
MCLPKLDAAACWNDERSWGEAAIAARLALWDGILRQVDRVGSWLAQKVSEIA